MRRRLPVIVFFCLVFMNPIDVVHTVQLAFADENQQVSTIGYGLVTAKIKKNVTTQEDIIVLLGAPNITTTDAEGSETWVYDKVSTETVQQGKISGEGSRDTTVDATRDTNIDATRDAKVDATGQGREFGVNVLVAGYRQGNQSSSSDAHVADKTSANVRDRTSANVSDRISAQNEVKRTTMTKNFTLIIKFNDDKTVKTYSVRAANF